MSHHQMVFCCFVKPVKSFAVMVSLLVLFCLSYINLKNSHSYLCYHKNVTENALKIWLTCHILCSSSCLILCITRTESTGV